MKKMVNKVRLQGYVYDFKLDRKVTGPNSKNPGTEYITGTVSLATDEDCVNIVPVHFSYVTAGSSKNSAYRVLSDLIDKKMKCIMNSSKDEAGKLQIDTSIAVNDFYIEKDGKDELVSAKRNEGGFVEVINGFAETLDETNRFDCDIVITNVRYVEADDERNLPEKAIVKGAIFDFRNALLPVEFTATAPGAINYFVGLEASPNNPTFTKLWGTQISTTVVKKIVEESAWGEDSVREVKNSRKEWLILGSLANSYIWDDEETITAAELSEAIAKREIYLATVKENYLNYKNSKNKSTPTVTTPAPSGATFNF